MSGTTPKRHSPPYGKRIILICDGTWNDATALKNDDPIWTNPQRLARCIAPFDEAANKTQCVIYLRGVGTSTSWFLNQREAAFGSSIKESILLGYYQISLNWTSSDADEIILVGFSRGGYVAMAIARLLQDIGMQKSHHSPQSMDETWKQWKEKCETGESPSILERIERGTHMDPLKVQACLVWDTVKAVDMFTNEVSFLPDKKVADCSHIRHAYHALALNEHRKKFKPMLWYTRVQGSAPTNVLKQCWFLGHHSDVGGASCLGSARLSLAWMITHIQNNKILRLNESQVENYMRQRTLSDGKLKLVDPMIQNRFWWLLSSKQREPGENLYAEKTHQTIHWSVKKLRDDDALLDGVWRFQNELETPETPQEVLTKEEFKTLLPNNEIPSVLLLNTFKFI